MTLLPFRVVDSMKARPAAVVFHSVVGRNIRFSDFDVEGGRNSGRASVGGGNPPTIAKFGSFSPNPAGRPALCIGVCTSYVLSHSRMVSGDLPNMRAMSLMAILLSASLRASVMAS